MSNQITNGSVSLSPTGATVTAAETALGGLLYLSSDAVWSEGEPIRGGVPVVAPWFDTFGGEPKHGWARRETWNVEKIDGGFRAELARGNVVLGLDATGGDDHLRVRLTIENTGDVSDRIQIAFHPYFAVSDVEQVRIEGLDGVKLLDRLDGQTSTVSGDVTVEGEFDRIALATPEIRIVDAERTITVTSDGADSTIVWNPGEKKADTMDDVGPHEWKKFVCVEPALLGNDQEGVQLSPGEINTLEMTARVTAN